MNSVAGPSNYAQPLQNIAGKRRTSSVEDQPNNKRRVPSDQRQRTQLSCDRCKTRKIRCIRTNGSEEACATCEQAKAPCSSTLPRRQRLYGSVDKLNARYRALDALVKGLYPHRDTEDLVEIARIGEENGFDLPTFLDPKLEALSSSKHPKTDAQMITQPYISSHSIPSLPSLGLFKIPEGMLIPAPRGGFHYVGPASSFYFAKTVRNLVEKANLGSFDGPDGEVFRRYIQAAEFSSFRVSQALEARIQGHPATNAANDAEPIGQTSPTDFPTPHSVFRTGRWQDTLPSRQLCDRLVETFFSRVHPNYTIFHRGNFYVRYESIWSKSQTGKHDPGWLCCFLMVLVLGALALEEEGLTDAALYQQRYLTIVIKDGLPRLALTASLANVQALMLLALYQHNAAERNTSWMLLGQAARTAVALGMHRDGETGNFDPIERNTRRMVWWVLYCFEQNLSFLLGRPSNTDLIDTSAQIPDENVTDGGDLPPGWLAQMIALTEISVLVKRFTASILVEYADPDTLAASWETAEQINQKLILWRTSLPHHLKADYHSATPRHHRAVLLLHIYAHHTHACLGRPFLLCQVNHEIEERMQIRAPLHPQIGVLGNIAVNQAKLVLDMVHKLASAKLFEGQVWLDFCYVHHSILILGLPYLGHPFDRIPEHQSYKEITTKVLNHCQYAPIAPTYRILLGMSMQFAFIVGLIPADVSEEEIHPTNPVPGDPEPFSLEQIFGPFPSRHGSPSDAFADLYNFGLGTDANSGMTWDFFNIAGADNVNGEGVQGMEEIWQDPLA